MLKLLVCCAGIVLLSGCGVTLDNGKWRPMDGDEARYTFDVKRLNFSEAYCNMESSNEDQDRCLAANVEPRRYLSDLNKEKSYGEGTSVSSGSLGLTATVVIDDAKFYSASDLDTDEVKPAILTGLSMSF